MLDAGDRAFLDHAVQRGRLTAEDAEGWAQRYEGPPGGLADALVRLRISYDSDEAVAFAEPHFLYHVERTPNDYGEYLWGMHNTGQTGGTPDADIDAPEAWEALGATVLHVDRTRTGDHGAVVVRPDRYVAAVADTQDEIEQTTKDLLAKLAIG